MCHTTLTVSSIPQSKNLLLLVFTGKCNWCGRVFGQSCVSENCHYTLKTALPFLAFLEAKKFAFSKSALDSCHLSWSRAKKVRGTSNASSALHISLCEGNLKKKQFGTCSRLT